MNKTLYSLHWGEDKVNFAKGLNASEVARKLSTSIIPKKIPFELKLYVNGTETKSIIVGDYAVIWMNRDFGISPTILKALA